MKIASKDVLLCYGKQGQWRKVRWFVTLDLLKASLWKINSTKFWRWTIKIIWIMRITITWNLTAWNTIRRWVWLSRYSLNFAKWKSRNWCSSIVYIHDNYDLFITIMIPYYHTRQFVSIFGVWLRLFRLLFSQFTCTSTYNWSRPSAVYTHQWIGSASVQMMDCRLFGTKALSEPKLIYC